MGAADWSEHILVSHPPKKIVRSTHNDIVSVQNAIRRSTTSIILRKVLHKPVRVTETLRNEILHLWTI